MIQTPPLPRYRLLLEYSLPLILETRLSSKSKVLLYAVSDKRALLYFIQYVTCELVPDELRPSEAAREKKGHKAVMKSVARVPKSSYRCFKAHLAIYLWYKYGIYVLFLKDSC